MRTPTELLSETTRAFLRHAYGCFYDAFSKVDLLKKLFTPALVFQQTLLNFRSAVLRYGYTLRLHYIRKRFSTRKKKMPPEEARERFKSLITIEARHYSFSLTPAFQNALDADERAVATSRGNLPAQPRAAG